MIMTHKKVEPWQVIAAVIAAVIFWFFLFAKNSDGGPLVPGLNFWIFLPFAAGSLAAWAIYCGGLPFDLKQFRLKAIGIGAVSAVMLWVIFYLGNFFSGLLFDFAPGQVGNVYDMRKMSNPVLISLMLLFVSSPGEEIFWRGFLQKWAMNQWGGIPGWLATAACYAAVHIVSGNFILVMAALVAGLFWGLMYLWLKGNLVPVIISHSLWTFGIFIVFPVE